MYYRENLQCKSWSFFYKKWLKIGKRYSIIKLERKGGKNVIKIYSRKF